ncbi:MAG: bifunctional 3,4-dihydroxy-2-butanone-4-phosphate synthase/GTP cyclohydrolase II [Dehalococcoidia bacterium]|nr:bifunctional 3,4-dihydroxy-2-butanone-4-phosphate synthase/GTP cyclohydrolase II [Dehalococcoidia bacterium]
MTKADGVRAATEALEEIAQGRSVIVLDDVRGLSFLSAAAEKATAEDVNIMARYARGIIGVAIPGERLAHLRIPVIAPNTKGGQAEPYAVSVDVKREGSAGMSARDRAATIKALLDPESKPDDFVRPGHLFPLRYAEGGVFTTFRAPEALVDLVKMAGLYPAGVLCAIMADDGDMMHKPVDLSALANTLGVKIVKVSEVVMLRGQREKVVRRLASARLPTAHGEFAVLAYECVRDADEHIALVTGDIASNEPVAAAFVRGCVVGHVFDNQVCQCGARLREKLRQLADLGAGVLLYTPSPTVSKHLGDGPEAALSAQDKLWYRIIGLQVLADLGVRRALLLDEEEEVEVPQLSTV